MSAGFLEHGDHLIAADAGKPSEEVVDAIAGLEVIEKAPYGHPRTGEDALASENIGVRAGRIRSFHERRLVPRIAVDKCRVRSAAPAENGPQQTRRHSAAQDGGGAQRSRRAARDRSAATNDRNGDCET